MLNITVVIRGSESIKILEAWAAPLLLIVAIGLVFWAWPKVSIEELLATEASRPEGAPFFGYFMAALTAMVGFWATLSLNIPDFSRFAKSQRSQIIGQIIGLPLTMFLFSGLGVLLTAASMNLVGETIADLWPRAARHRGRRGTGGRRVRTPAGRRVAASQRCLPWLPIRLRVQISACGG